MTDSSTDPDHHRADEPGHEQGELVDADDTVIATAFRRSMAVIGALLLIVALIAFVRTRDKAAAPVTTIATEAPTEVVRAQSAPTVRFVDVATLAGVDFVHTNGATGEKLLPETMGGGVAFFDADGDEDPDLLFVNSSSWPHDAEPSERATMKLYRNDGGVGTIDFTDVTRAAGLDLSFYGMGAAVADVDADGDRDLFLTAVGANRLLLNEGTDAEGVPHFRDVTETAGVAGDADAWSTSAGFFDADGDGDLDLFVCNYVQWSKEIDFELDFRLTGVGRAFGPPQSYQGTTPYLYRNDGPDADGVVRFTDVSAESGVQVMNPATGQPMAKALALLPIDVDHDHDLDVLVANDTVQNFFFENAGDGTFEEVGEIYGLAYDRNGNATGAMGIDAGHHRNDPNLGFVIGNFANEMTSVYVSQDDPAFFVDEAIGEGIGAPSRLMLTFGLVLFDYDLDGRLDVLAANGHIEEDIGKVDSSQRYHQPGQLFWNAGADEGFLPVAPDTTGDLGQEIVGRGTAVADLDGDGDLDAVLTQIAGPPLVLRNDQASGHHWLRIRLQDEAPNRDAIGAWVTVEAGGTTQRRQVMPTRSYLSQIEPTLTFGLGSSTQIDAITINWPDGSEQTVTVPNIDTTHVIAHE